jgi:hypothetical protein
MLSHCAIALSHAPESTCSDAGVAEIPDPEIAHGSFLRKLPKWRLQFEECREGVAAAR